MDRGFMEPTDGTQRFLYACMILILPYVIFYGYRIDDFTTCVLAGWWVIVTYWTSMWIVGAFQKATQP